MLEDTSWDVFVDNAPAWTIQISGDDLSKDGKVTVTIDRATQHLLRDATASVLRGATYVIDPASKSITFLQGEIKDGVLTIKPQHIYLEGETPFYVDIELDKGQMRIKRQADGSLSHTSGGFTDWLRYAYMGTARPFQTAPGLKPIMPLKRRPMLIRILSPAKIGDFRHIPVGAVPAFLANTKARSSRPRKERFKWKRSRKIPAIRSG